MAEIKISSVKLFIFYAKVEAGAATANISVRDRNSRGRMSWRATFKDEVCGLATTSPGWLSMGGVLFFRHEKRRKWRQVIDKVHFQLVQQTRPLLTMQHEKVNDKYDFLHRLRGNSYEYFTAGNG